jgi:myo-inositol 2-dehydrogenase / D-chiro-inositol 1-dehydrogenase
MSGGSLDRRDFMKTAAAATGWTIVSSSAVRGTQANGRLEVGIIGSGGRGRFVARLFEQHTNTKVVALHDYFADRVQKLGDELSVPADARFTGLDGYRRLLERPCDAVCIESPPYFHPEQTLATLQAGKHVYLAKPLAVDVTGCLAIQDAARRAGDRLKVLVDFQTRRDPLFREAAERVHRGDIGKAVMGHVYYHASRLRPQAPEGTPTARLRNWVFDKALSGDIIVEQNIHVIDVANWYLQGHPVAAHGTGGRKARVDVGDCWDHFVVTFTYPNDVLVDFSSAQFTRGFDDLRTRVYGTTGTVDSAYEGPVKITGQELWEGGHTKGLYTSGTVGNIQDFHAALTGGGPLADTLTPSLESNLASILGRTAAYERRTVTWDEMMKDGARLDPKLQLPPDGPHSTN